jgi:hypothetical protein
MVLAMGEVNKRGLGGGTNLVHYVLERVRAVDGKADKDEVGFWIGKRAQPVVFFLAGCVP